MHLLEPKNIIIQDGAGKDMNFIISKFPAWQGCEIMDQWAYAHTPKIGNYLLAQELKAKLLAFVAVEVNGNILKLDSQALINNHAREWKVMKKLEDAMIEYNDGFFQSGWISIFLEESARTLAPKVSKILMDFWVQLSQMIKQP